MDSRMQEWRVEGLAVEMFTEMRDMGMEQGGVERVVGLGKDEALRYVTDGFRQLCQRIREQTSTPLIDPERHSYESILQKLESDLRSKAKLTTETKKEVGCSTEVKSKSVLTDCEPKIVLKYKPDEKARDDYLRLLKSLSDSQIANKRDQMLIVDIERRLKRCEAELMEARDSLAEKSRECERWKKEYEIMRLFSKSRESLPVNLFFSESRRRPGGRFPSSSPTKLPSAIRKNTSESSLIPIEAGPVSMTEQHIYGRSVRVHHSPSTVMKRSPLLRKSSAHPSAL